MARTKKTTRKATGGFIPPGATKAIKKPTPPRTKPPSSVTVKQVPECSHGVGHVTMRDHPEEGLLSPRVSQPEAVQEAVPDAMPGTVPEAVPEAVPGAVPDAVPDAVQPPINGSIAAPSIDTELEESVKRFLSIHRGGAGAFIDALHFHRDKLEIHGDDAMGLICHFATLNEPPLDSYGNSDDSDSNDSDSDDTDDNDSNGDIWGEAALEKSVVQYLSTHPGCHRTLIEAVQFHSMMLKSHGPVTGKMCHFASSMSSYPNHDSDAAHGSKTIDAGVRISDDVAAQCAASRADGLHDFEWKAEEMYGCGWYALEPEQKTKVKAAIGM